MSGRKEKDLLVEDKIKKKLNGAPEILKAYMLNMENRNKTALSRLIYLNYLLDFFDYLQDKNLDIVNTKPMDIDGYINHVRYPNGKTGRENGASIINGKMSAVSSLFDFMLDNDMIDKNPCLKFKKIKVDEKDHVVYMTPDEIHTVKHRISVESFVQKSKYYKRDLAIVTLGVSTGLRVSAITNIDIKDIDFVNHSIYVVEKGNKERIINIGSNTEKTLLDWIDERKKIINKKCLETDALFISQKGNRISNRAVGDMINKYTYGLGKNITPHKLRSTCGMNLYDKTGDIYLVQQQLGHSNIKNTMIYAKASEEKKRMAADILDNM